MKAFDTFFYILWTFGIYYGHLVYFMVYMLWSFDVFYGIFCVHLVYFSRFGMFTKKNLATLFRARAFFCFA
jgi:hypothetical protein